jgi:ABC transporter substrate binding protein
MGSLIVSRARAQNITGVARLTRELAGKRLELLKEVVPRVSRVGVLWDADDEGSANGFKEYGTAASALKIQLQSLQVHSPNPDLEGAFRGAAKGHANAIIVVRGPLLRRYAKQIADLTIKNRIPCMCEGSDSVEAGGLMSYSTSDTEKFPPRRHIRGQNPQRHQAQRFARRATDEVRVCHQSKDGEGAQPDDSTVGAIPGGQGDQVILDSGSVTNRRRSRLEFVFVAAFSIFLSRCVAFGGVTSGCDNIRITSDELTVLEAEEYCRYVARERNKVEAFWGPTWKETIHIHVDSSYKISKALITKTRGFMEMPLTRVREKTSAVLHEIVHIYAPNRNRFLAEGLAVYLQDKMGGNPAFPNFGKDLRALARDRLSRVSSLERLNNVTSPRPLSTVIHQQSAYILAGSFVGFLIEKYSVALFRDLYETGSYETVYVKPLSVLEEEWRSEVQR